MNNDWPGERISDSPLTLPFTEPPCRLAWLLHLPPPTTVLLGTEPDSWKSSGNTGTSVFAGKLVKESTSLLVRKSLIAAVSILPASINESRDDVRLRSARSPQSDLESGWQNDRG